MGCIALLKGVSACRLPGTYSRSSSDPAERMCSALDISGTSLAGDTSVPAKFARISVHRTPAELGKQNDVSGIRGHWDWKRYCTAKLAVLQAGSNTSQAQRSTHRQQLSNCTSSQKPFFEPLSNIDKKLEATDQSSHLVLS